jgi:hypothetical protein
MPNTAHKKHKPTITVDPNMPDFSRSSFIVKKVEKARAFIAKHGLPKKEEARKRK